MFGMSERRCDPAGGTEADPTQKLKHLREKTEDELLDELTLLVDQSDEYSMDIDLLDAYLDTLDEKAPAPVEFDTAAALASFKEKHALLLEHELAEEKTSAARRTHNHGFHRRLLAILAVIALCVSMTVQAFGIDIFGAIARWTQDVFSFGMEDPPQAQGAVREVVPSEDLYASLRETMNANSFDSNIKLPSWHPSGYVCTDIVCRSLTDSTKIRAVCSNSSKEFSVTVWRFSSVGDAEKALLEKDEGEVEEYVVGGVKHFILTNELNQKVTWADADTLLIISGDLTIDELKSMIDSIYEG